MTKRDLIDRIIHLNPTAEPAFLARFDDADLAEYLEHLRWVVPPSGPGYRRTDPLVVHSAPPVGSTSLVAASF